MAKPSDSLTREYGFFHANSKTLTKEGQYTFESEYSAGHVLLMKDILAEEIPYFATQTELDDWMINHPGIIKKYDKVSLVQVKSSISGLPTTDGQSWFIEDVGKWIKPIIVGSLAPNPTNNKPSSILDPVLYKSDGTTIVPSTMGVWWIDPFQGLLRFGAGYEPSSAAAYGGVAIGTPKLSCYAYVGKKLLDVLGEQVQNRDYVYTASTASLEHTIIHGLNTTSLQCNIYESNGASGWTEIMTGIEHLDNNTSIVRLTESQIIKVIFRKIG